MKRLQRNFLLVSSQLLVVEVILIFFASVNSLNENYRFLKIVLIEYFLKWQGTIFKKVKSDNELASFK